MRDRIETVRKIQKVKNKLEQLHEVIGEQMESLDPALVESFNLLSEEYIDNISNILECVDVKPSTKDKAKVIKLIRNGQWF